MKIENMPKIIVGVIVALIVVVAVAIPIISDASDVRFSEKNANALYSMDDVKGPTVIEISEGYELLINGESYNLDFSKSNLFAVIAYFNNGMLLASDTGSAVKLTGTGFGSATVGDVTKVTIDGNAAVFSRVIGGDSTIEITEAKVINKDGKLATFENGSKLKVDKKSPISLVGFVKMDVSVGDLPIGNTMIPIIATGTIDNITGSVAFTTVKCSTYTLTPTDVSIQLNATYDEVEKNYTVDPATVSIGISGTSVNSDESTGSFTATKNPAATFTLIAPLYYSTVNQDAKDISTIINIVPVVLILALIVGIVGMILYNRRN